MYFEDIPLGIKITLGSYEFTEENILAFARAYDPQYFHVDKDAAANGPYMAGYHCQRLAYCFGVDEADDRQPPRRTVVEGEAETQANYVSPGVRDLRWLKPVRPGTELLTYTNEPSAKLDYGRRVRNGDCSKA